MRRHATTLLVLALLAASAVAFVVAERLKLEKSPVAGTEVDKVFSPACHCPSDRARISFRLRRNDRLTLSLLDREGHEVRTLVHRERYPMGRHVFFWNGRDNDGMLVPEGPYRPKVELGRADRTIVLPNPIRVDVTRPRVRVVGTGPHTISPDGDGRRDAVRVRYRLTERGRAQLAVNGVVRVTRKGFRPAGVLTWEGGDDGRILPPGRYRLAVRATDLAGNVARPASAGAVEIRFVRFPEKLVLTAPRRPVRVAVDADGPVRWTLRRGSSVVAQGKATHAIRLRAPRRSGRYVLTAEIAGHRARALVVVRKRR